MKKILAIILTLLVMTAMYIVTAFAAAKTIEYYEENGNQITVNGMYYNSQGMPMYNSECYYLDEDGNPVYVGGCRVYYYDEDGNLVPGRCYYDSDGNAVPCPSSCPGGYGCGKFGKSIELPADNHTREHCRGGCWA